ncbi:MAG TPA: carnitine 3-dehydrogenase [Solirubrobacteraceae bacterium]|jgi:carnitine 3-dehydrogenase|nr:carnitine 3-dehydrogenase [Solirubrobacteraceae bacterium]
MSELPGAVGLLGGGVIGGGWAARFVLSGVDVALFDPALEAQRRVREMLDNARRAYRSLTMVPLPREGELRFVDSVEEAVAGTEFVQESAPERLEIKRELLRAASQAAQPDVVICSSTSGIRPTLMQELMEDPGRLVVGHPFNPVYLVPLVEVCGGEQTDPAAVKRAIAIYEALGMHPLHVRREIDGFVADRLLEALWREGLWLVHDDVATVAELDDAIRYGAGLRWAFMGTFLTYRIAGGEAGMRHFLSQFGPALQAPWTKLMDVPELTPELVEKLAAQSDEQVGQAETAELERWRDDCLVSVLQGLRAVDAGAGQTLARWEQGLLDAAGRDGPRASDVPLRLVVQEIPPAWVDYNDHVHESRYLQLFADATDALLRLIGVDAAYVAATGSFYTVETHLSHLGQAFAGDRVSVETQVLGFDGKRLHVFHRLLREGEAEPLATAEQMLLHVDAGAGRVAPADGSVGERAAEIARGHEGLPRPDRAGRSIVATS